MPLVQFTSQKMAVIVKNTLEAGGSGSGSLVMDGFVNRRADIRPLGAGGATYMKMKQEQIKKALAPTRTAQLYDKVVNNFKPTMNNNILKRKGRGEEKAVKPEKRLREDKDVVTERVLAAFEKHQYYALNDLVEITQQPITFLKQEVLKELCDYVSKGEHKSTYQLKPEYRNY